MTEVHPVPDGSTGISAGASGGSARHADIDAIIRRIVGDLGVEVSEVADELVLRLARDSVVQVCRLLKETAGLDFAYLRCLSVVDWVEDLEVVYHLASIAHSRKLVVKVRVPIEDPWAPTLIPVWRGADWHEREAHDLFGIEFHGHPNMTPLILYDGFEGFPGRKSYPMPEQVTFYGD